MSTLRSFKPTTLKAKFHLGVATPLRSLRGILLLALLPALLACGQDVDWNEEVPLNTGETVWVKRHARYEIQGGAGNPLDFKYRPTRQEAIRFHYAGKNYSYEGDARLMVLAISPTGVPSLVAKADDNSWNFVHKYGCTVPFYVQMVPSADGMTWTWPRQIEPWLYGIPKNLLLARFKGSEMRRNYSTLDRESLDRTGVGQEPAEGFVKKEFTGDLCGR